MAEWSFYVFFLFPLPLILLFLLSIPLPASFRSFTLRITDIVFINFSGNSINLYNISLTLSTLLLFLSTHVSHFLPSSPLISPSSPTHTSSQSVLNHNKKEILPERSADHRCYRWRLERNFWISVLAFILWLVLGRFRSALMESERYRQEIKRLETKTD